MLDFNRADAQTVAALHRMNASEMKPLLEFVNKQMEDTQTALLTADVDMFRRLQGRAGYIKEFLSAVNSAAATLEKLRT